MTVLCLDISSGGVSAALFNSRLLLLKLIEDQWELTPDKEGAATLSIETISERFKEAVRELDVTEPLQAICVGSFMHNCVLLDEECKPLTSVFTWLDRRGERGLEYLRERVGESFHERTGCRFHPMFPVFKLATLYLEDKSLLARAAHVVSVRTFLTHGLTGIWAEDQGMASASGLYNIRDRDWDSTLAGLVGLRLASLPPISDRNRIVGRTTRDGASEFGLPEGVPVINGSGDGFLAHLGSGCDTPAKLSVSLGTSAVVRQLSSKPVLNPLSGTFCYQADQSTYLLGCAGSNGGNALNWGRSVFGNVDAEAAADPPLFIPLLHGERSPEWNPHLKGSWHGLTALHTTADLARSVVEGVTFNLGHFVEIVQNTSGDRASEIILSGNGFLNHLTAPILAAIVPIPAWLSSEPGLASLRGAGICALQALGLPVPLLAANGIDSLKESRIVERFAEYKRLRAVAPFL